MTTVAFSIATPTRNALQQLKRCVGSVRGQHSVALEHLVQDACSSDGTAQWLALQAEQRMELRPTSEPDNGMYDGINRAWARASGQYLSWLNSDEQYLPGALQTVQRIFEDRPDVDVVFGDYVVCNGQGRIVAARREIPLRPIYVANSFLYAYSCTLFYRSKLRDAGLLKLDARYRYASDKDLVLRLARQGVKFLHVPHYLAIFGIDGNNLSTHQAMLDEAEQVRRSHGALGSRMARQLILSGRRLERLLAGAYGSSRISIQYAADEVPNYQQHTAARVGGRYRLSDFS